MTGQALSKEDYARINRVMFLLLNRAMMYKADHPHIKDAIGNLHRALTEMLADSGSLVLLLNRDQLFLDEEPVDPRINAGRIVALFKKNRVQSVSFDAGITVEELQALIDILTAPQTFSDCDKMAAELDFRGVRHVRINHVFYKKVTRDDEVVSRREARPTASPAPGGADPAVSQKFMKMVVESVLAEEAGKTLSLKNLLADPAGLSRTMLETENRTRQAAADAQEEGDAVGEKTGEIAAGAALLYQIQALNDDVDRQMATGEPVNMMDVADAVCEMKRQLSIGIEAQKAVNQAYANEEQLLGQMSALTDNVVIKLIRSEYQQGKITTVRLAQILRRLIPEPGDLKRLLPKIKAALIFEGMSIADYLQLVRHLGRELENEGLSSLLMEAAESVGVEGEELIAEIRAHPERAAELMAIAAEIRKGTGDEKGFTEMLVGYVEELGARMHQEAADAGDAGEEGRARDAMAEVGSGLIAQLKSMNLKGEALLRLEERINARMGELFGKMAAGGAAFSPAASSPPPTEKTLLQMIEQSVRDNEQLKNALRIIRSRTDADKIDENSFEQIYAFFVEHEKALRDQEARREVPPGVLKTSQFRFLLEKEILRAKRHDLPLSTLSFTIMNVRLNDPDAENRKIRKSEVFAEAYRKLISITRASDLIGELNSGAMSMILPMTDKAKALVALKRISKLMNDHLFEIGGIRLYVVLAGSVVAFLPEMKPNVELFMKSMAYELEHAVSKIKYVQSLT